MLFVRCLLVCFIIEQERGGAAVEKSNAADSFLQLFCMCLFIKFTSFNNWQITFIYWHELFIKKIQNGFTEYTFLTKKNIMTFSCVSPFLTPRFYLFVVFISITSGGKNNEVSFQALFFFTKKGKCHLSNLLNLSPFFVWVLENFADSKYDVIYISNNLSWLSFCAFFF